MIEIILNSDLDEHNNTDFSELVLAEYFDIHEYSKFNFEITSESLSCNFSGNLDHKNTSEIENFLNLINTGEKCKIDFNGGNGSAILYENNKLEFFTYSYKEGDFIQTCFCLDIQDDDIFNKMIEIFNKLLYIRKELDKITFQEDLEEEYVGMNSHDEQTDDQQQED
jgi:hypothetical protein